MAKKKINEKNSKVHAFSGNLDEIHEDVEEIHGDVEEIHEDVEEIHEGVEEIKKVQKSLLRRVSSRIVPEEFAWDDLAQQIVGAIVLSTPLAVTAEVWQLAHSLELFRAVLIVVITLVFNILLIYYTKYQIVKEQKILSFIPLRLFSQLVVSYLSALTMLYVFGVIGGQVTGSLEILKLVILVGLFANIGAGTADLLK